MPNICPQMHYYWWEYGWGQSQDFEFDAKSSLKYSAIYYYSIKTFSSLKKFSDEIYFRRMIIGGAEINAVPKIKSFQMMIWIRKGKLAMENSLECLRLITNFESVSKVLYVLKVIINIKYFQLFWVISFTKHVLLDNTTYNNVEDID